MNNIYITGDTHGDFSRLYIKHNKDDLTGDIVIIVGDFGGIWASTDKYLEIENEKLQQLSELPFTIMFIDGNHENFTRLYEFPVVEKFGGKCHKIRKNLFHMIRGELFDILGNRFFAFGGAFSHDIQGGILNPSDENFEKELEKARRGPFPFRVLGVSWWEEEKPNQKEMDYARDMLQKCNNKVDYILTHQAPSPLEREIGIVYDGFFGYEFPDFLREIQITVDYKRWFFGHYHQDKYYEDGKHILLYESFFTLPPKKA